MIGREPQVLALRTAKRRFRVPLLSCAFFLFITAMASADSGEELIAPGSDWRYFDLGISLPPTWTFPFYDDASWPVGPAQFGYGEGDEATVVSFGPDPDTKYITTYFRKTFVTTNATDSNQLLLGVLRDDGVVVYLNGAEIYRNNMPAGAIDANTLAVTNVAGVAENTFFEANLNTSLLVNGTNVLAVEVHQAWPDSIDLSFDLRLSLALLTRGPYLQQGSTTNTTVRWRTSRETVSRVRFGTDLAAKDRMVEDLVPRTEHELTLTGLLPDTRYYYRIESSDDALADGSDYFFVTAPVAAKPTRFWVLGDPGTANGNQRAVRDAYYNFAGQRHTDLWLMLGDNAYDIGTDQQYQKAVFDMYPEMLRKSVLWPTIGNHDTYSDPQLLDFPYLHIFTLPTQGEVGGVASGTKRYYSFNYGNIHFVCLDAMSSIRTAGSPMLQWLEQDLAANTNEWLIAFWHHPPYTKGSHDSDWEIELVEMRQNAVPILENYGVDLVLCGHSHSYERSYLIDGHYGTTDTWVPSMAVNYGDGRIFGNGPYTKPIDGPAAHQGAVYAVAGSSGQTSGGSFDHPAMYISLNLLGSMVIDIDGNTLNAQFLRSDGIIGDSFTIVKGPDANAPRITSFGMEEYKASLTWISIPGRYYVVRFKRHIEGNWMDVTGPLFAFEDTSSWADFVPGDAATGFFQVVLLSD